MVSRDLDASLVIVMSVTPTGLSKGKVFVETFHTIILSGFGEVSKY